MSFQEKAPPPATGSAWNLWAERLVDYLGKTKVVLAKKLVFDATVRNPVTVGQVTWNPDDDTLDIGHEHGVVQQVGQETYIRVLNSTGSTVTNGTVVSFAGVDAEEIEITQYIATGVVPNFYFVGVATSDIANGDTGKITTFGKVRSFNTTGSDVSESWVVGDILYASPTTAGKFTKVRPTAPNEVVIIAAVLVVDATNGQIMVRPIIPIGFDYAAYSSDAIQTATVINTAYAITWNTVEFEHGLAIGSPISRIVASNAGLYSFSVTLQLKSTNASTKTMFVWIRKNGTDIARTRLDQSNNINTGSNVLSFSLSDVSLQVSDYVEIMWAVDDLALFLQADSAFAFAPANQSAVISINQKQL